MVSFACPDARARKERPMTKKTCACCDYPLDPKSTIKVKIGGKDVEGGFVFTIADICL
jgi:hypothetical protein